MHTLEVIARFRTGMFEEETLVKELNDGSYDSSIIHPPEFFSEKAKQQCIHWGYLKSTCLVCEDMTQYDDMKFKLTSKALSL
jgi:hypothetical protein